MTSILASFAIFSRKLLARLGPPNVHSTNQNPQRLWWMVLNGPIRDLNAENLNL